MQGFEFINKFGVELEGGWNEPFPRSYLWNGGAGRDRERSEPPYPTCEDENENRCEECDECREWDRYNNGDDYDDEGSYRHEDGSVTVRADYVGEIATPPYSSYPKFKEDFFKVYPNTVNSSCGMHLHVSVNTRMGDEVSLYSSMMSKKFHKFIIKGMKRWATKTGVRAGSAFWRRLDGSNSFCRDSWAPDEQARCRGRDSVRYSFINYCYLVEGRKTVEFRFLPMFETPAFGEKAIHNLLRLINAYLKLASKKNLHIVQEIEEIEILDPNEIKEELVTWKA